MSSMKYIVPALAIAGRAAAQSSCSASTTTIQNAGDAAGLSACTTFSGSVTIATGTTDSIALDGVKAITGDLVAKNVTGLTSFSAGSLEKVGGEFNLNGLTILSSLTFPKLTDVGSIVWEALPALQGLSFTTGVQTADELNIQNTQLNSLDGINLEVVDTVYIANNPYLQDIQMQLGNISTSLTLEANGKNVSAIFPNLMWAYNMTFRNVSRVSIPSLESVNGSLGFYSNMFSELNAANLTTVGGSLSFVSNTNLEKVDMPLLKSISGAFQLANNTELETIDGFPKLATVGGALDFYGNFTNVTLDSLTDVRGAFNMQSSEDITDVCTDFHSKSGSNNVIKGKFVCAGTVAKPSGQGSTPTSTGTSGSGSASAGAAAGLYIPGASGLMGLVAVVFGLM